MERKLKAKQATEDESPKARKLNLSTVDPEVEWVKLAGTFMFKGKTYTKGDRFTARQSEIPIVFRDTIRPVNELPESRPIEFVPGGYQAVPSDQEGYFDIVNSQGVKLNSQPLTQIEATETIKKLK